MAKWPIFKGFVPGIVKESPVSRMRNFNSGPRMPTCGHPERKHRAHGKCDECYARNRYLKSGNVLRNKGRERILRQRGLSGADYDSMLVIQAGRCALCGELPGDAGRSERLNIDHCHASGKVRGLLCSMCNQGLGFFRDNPEILVKAATYLINHQSEKAHVE